MSAWIPAAIMGGSTLASGLLGKKQKTQWDFEERRYLEKNRFKWLVRGAKRAGFNPLTVLGATGGQMGGGPTSTSSPMGMRVALADALKSAAYAYLDHDPVAEETAQLEQDLLRKQIAQIDNEAKRYGSYTTAAAANGGVPSVQRTASPTAEGVPQGYDAAGNATGHEVYTVYDQQGNPVEVEVDAGGALSQGRIGEYAVDMLDRNVSSPFLRSWGKAIASPFIAANQAGNWIVDKIQQGPKPPQKRVKGKIMPVPQDRMDERAARRLTGGW